MLEDPEGPEPSACSSWQSTQPTEVVPAVWAVYPAVWHGVQMDSRALPVRPEVPTSAHLSIFGKVPS